MIGDDEEAVAEVIGLEVARLPLQQAGGGESFDGRVRYRIDIGDIGRGIYQSLYFGGDFVACAGD